VDRVVVFRKAAGLAGVYALFEALRGTRCDVAVNFMRYLKSVFPLFALGAPVRIGLPPSKTRDGIRFAHTHRLSEGPWCHTQDLFLRFRDPLGLPDDAPVEWRITFSREERDRQTAFFAPLRSTGRRVVGVVLATANPAKDWPAERYPALVAGLASAFDAQVVLIGGPSPAEDQAARLVMSHNESPGSVTWGLGDSVRRMMWMVDGVDLLVSPDTGPLHIAHALQVPVVGLFGHTNPWRVGPWRHFHDLIVDRYTDAGEQPDPSRYEPRHGRMERIGVDDVLAAVQRGMARGGTRTGTPVRRA
jgi:heptosyltransferase I